MTGAARRLIVPGLTTVAMLAVLIGLGTWQVRRLAWKESLLAQIAQAESADPVALSDSPAPFAKVAVTGTLLPQQAAWYGAEVRTTAAGPQMGARMIVPLRRANGQIVLVDRGWVPSERSTPLAQPSGEVTVSGYVRGGDRPGWFSAPDDPLTRRFYTLDPAAIARAVGVPEAAGFLVVEVAAHAPADRLPVPAQHLPRPPNNHLGYAITWYGLAAALLVVFAVWVRKVTRA